MCTDHMLLQPLGCTIAQPPRRLAEARPEDARTSRRLPGLAERLCGGNLA